MDEWVIIIIILSFLMSFAIGSNDAANGLATSYGSNVAALWKLLLIGAIAEFSGGMWCSDKVTDTFTHQIIMEHQYLSPFTQKEIMVSICFSTFIFVIISSVWGVPISGTHTVVSAYIGAGLVSTGAIAWKNLSVIFISWIASPLLSSILAFILMIVVSKLTMDTKNWSFKARILWT